MAEEAQQDRTEQATPKRREDARKKGDVPRSRELTMTGVMLSGASALLLLAGPMGGDLAEAFASGFTIERELLLDERYLVPALAEIASKGFLSLVPLAVVLLCAVFFSAAAIGGWSFSLKATAFKVERLNPLKGIKRVFGANGLNELVKAIAKFSMVALIAVSWLWYSAADLLSLGRQPVAEAIGNALQLCGLSLLIVSLGLIVIAAFDVPFQLWQYEKKLRMTRQQVKDEFKETEGRPEVKARVRALQQQIATRRMMEELPTADVVITNPTHFAVALRYDDSSMGAPKVIAKGKDLIAKRIREVATEHGVPLFSAPPLARVLFRTTEIGDEIPARLYTAVAQILAYIYQLNETLRPGQRRPLPPVPEIDEDEFPYPVGPDE
ncbi:MAG: flagellar biosynthesis protein FlhB [Gammaproteobacteria bacterium]|nr:flagellar biosynthesis protein FlhB [Gammaproteobacteria bacterium]